MTGAISDVTFKKYLDEEVESAKEYWTPERMKGAKPYPMPSLSSEQLQELIQQNEQAGIIQNRRPVIMQDDPTLEGIQGTPQVADVNQRPFWNGGRFFFTTSQGVDSSGTAAFVGANNMVMTAAHCVTDPFSGAPYSNLMFYRAYNNGGGQKVGAPSVGVWTTFYNPATPVKTPWDYAFIRTNDLSGAGWLGLQLNLPYSSWTAIGYPGNFGNAQQMYKVVGNLGSNRGGVVIMNGNPMTGGASGGAWIGALSPDYGLYNNMAIGLTSGGSPDGQSVSGPYFDDNTYSLYEFIRTNPPIPPN
jgi:V8-like Glu-specific endopeptidase